MSIYSNLFGGEDEAPIKDHEEKKIKHKSRQNVDISKICSDKRGISKRPKEFPDEPPLDPLDEEAGIYVNNLLKNRKLDGKITENVGQENDYGKMEYKLTLIEKVKPRLRHLTTQLNFRLNEGKGQAIYRIGIEDNGNPIGINDDHLIGSLKMLYKMSKALNSDMLIDKLYAGIKGRIAYLLIQRRLLEKQKLDLRIILLGGHSVGKTTLMGVLVGGKSDDGIGLARSNVHKHKHEILSGATSSINEQIVGFDAKGNITNKGFFGQMGWPEILEASSKIIRFVDVSGQEKYSKSMLSAICSQYPDYALVLISGIEGITETTIQHLNLAFTLKVPVIILITKADLIGEEKLLLIRDEVKKVLKSLSISHVNFLVKTEADVDIFVKNYGESIVPILFISNKTQIGIDLFIQLLYSLPSHNDWNLMIKDHPEFHITDSYLENNLTILMGAMYKGTIKLKQRMLLGPSNDGKFMQVEIDSIKCLKELVQSAQAGQICSVRVKLGVSATEWIKNGGQIRRGMILVDGGLPVKATKSFIAQIWTIDGTSKKIPITYEPLIYCHNIKQTAILKTINETPCLESSPQRLFDIKPANNFLKLNSGHKEEKSKISPLKKHMRCRSFPKRAKKHMEFKSEKLEVSGKKTKVLFKFLYHPEYMELGSTFVIPDPSLYVIGEIIKIFYDA